MSCRCSFNFLFHQYGYYSSVWPPQPPNLSIQRVTRPRGWPACVSFLLLHTRVVTDNLRQHKFPNTHCKRLNSVRWKPQSRSKKTWKAFLGCSFLLSSPCPALQRRLTAQICRTIPQEHCSLWYTLSTVHISPQALRRLKLATQMGKLGSRCLEGGHKEYYRDIKDKLRKRSSAW